MRDFIINHRIAKCEHAGAVVKYDSHSSIVTAVYPVGRVIPLDYCNDWSITEPLTVKYNVSLELCEGGYNYRAEIKGSKIGKETHPNECKAAAMVIAKYVERMF
jgi:hypothetical protein